MTETFEKWYWSYCLYSAGKTSHSTFRQNYYTLVCADGCSCMSTPTEQFLHTCRAGICTARATARLFVTVDTVRQTVGVVEFTGVSQPIYHCILVLLRAPKLLCDPHSNFCLLQQPPHSNGSQKHTRACFARQSRPLCLGDAGCHIFFSN